MGALACRVSRSAQEKVGYEKAAALLLKEWPLHILTRGLLTGKRLTE